MDIDQAKKLSQDKIEADFLTGLVRRSIKRKELEKQQAREAFREAFEVLLKSQDKSTKTQTLMLDELRELNEKMEEEPGYEEIPLRRRRQRRRGARGAREYMEESEQVKKLVMMKKIIPAPICVYQVCYTKVFKEQLEEFPILLI